MNAKTCSATAPHDDDCDIWGGESVASPGLSVAVLPPAPAPIPDPFEGAPVIHAYGRFEAIADGVLVDLSVGEMGKLAREAGFLYPVACTAAVHQACIALTPAAKRALNDVKGRAWDVFWMLRNAILRSRGQSEILFELYVVRERARATRTQIKAVIGPGDNGEPVITLMFPEES
jgi:hypothetical protein